MVDPCGGWLDEHQQRAWRAYLEASRLISVELERQLQDTNGLSHTDYEVLVRLSEAPGRMIRMSELASQAMLSRSRLSHAVGRLEGLGWVRRESCPTDKRGTLAHLTDSGFGALEAAAPGHVDAVRRFVFDALSPEQVESLEHIGTAIRDLIESQPGSESSA